MSRDHMSIEFPFDNFSKFGIKFFAVGFLHSNNRYLWVIEGLKARETIACSDLGVGPQIDCTSSFN